MLYWPGGQRGRPARRAGWTRLHRLHGRAAGVPDLAVPPPRQRRL